MTGGPLNDKAVLARERCPFQSVFIRSCRLYGHRFRRWAGDVAGLVLRIRKTNNTGFPPVGICDESEWQLIHAKSTIEDVGMTAISRLIESSASTFPGLTSRPWHPAALAALLSCEDIANLSLHDHQEIFLLKLPAGKKRYIALISGDRPGALDPADLRRMHINLCYHLSGFRTKTNALGEPLSERERECLYWVSEGKTADEVSLILNVSSNTVNSYVAHAIHKLAAKNRAMAIATAIRNGLI